MNITTVARFRPCDVASEVEKLAASEVENLTASEVEKLAASEVEKLAAEFDGRLDTILTWTVPQDEFYNKYFRAHVSSMIQSKYNNTIIAYGYSGSGKTYTLNGMIRMALEDMATQVNSDNEISLAVVEIYVEKVYDLMAPGNVASILGNGTILSHQVTSRAKNVLDLEERLQAALDHRRTRATSLNQDSSRSHTLVILEVQGARLYIVDLAGCERVSNSNASGIGLVEAIAINKSLSSLHAVVAALSDHSSTHIPYRNSKITMALKQALGGNSRTAFILCCASDQATIGESRHTLEFGSRCKAIVTAPICMARKKSAKDLLIEHLRARISALESIVPMPSEALQIPPELSLEDISLEQSQASIDLDPLDTSIGTQTTEVPSISSSTLNTAIEPEFEKVIERDIETTRTITEALQLEGVPEVVVTIADIALQVANIKIPKKNSFWCC
jgi:hypothetical protein